MTLRARLSLGLIGMALVLLIPLLLALNSLERLEDTNRVLRDTDFAASIAIGRLRTATDDIRAAENALLFVHDDSSRRRMTAGIAHADSLAGALRAYYLERESAQVRSALASISEAAAAEYEAASAGRAPEAERISAGRLLPEIARINTTVRQTESDLRGRTAERVDEAATVTIEAQRTAAAALAIALLLALLIALWLLRSISTPVRLLEKGMKAVADGDFSYRLPYTGTRRDEFGRLAGSYQSMTRQLAELDKLKAEFISIASHELKTPINVIIGYLELLQEGIYGPLSPKQTEVAATMEKQAQTLTRLARQLLDVSRFEAGGGRVEPRKVDLARFLQHLEAAFQGLAVQRTIAFSVQHSPTLPTEVTWDEDRMNEVLGNLLSNAFKFTPRDGQVTLGLDGDESEVRITISDTGAGIPADQLRHIFEKFYQADNQASAALKGTGLGLAIAKQIVEAHHGTITVDSKQGSGTTFHLTLPAHAVVSRISGRHRASDPA
ncbi:MAG: HAMP domain-containing sensor histidine kinase [Gemmatimonadaceae bacterium]